jgi:cobalamin biosynthetic protein CobC
MLIRSQGNAPEALAPLAHGGDLAAARLLFPGAPEPFIDLSTGINPRPYPLPALAPEIFARLPDRASIRRLAAIAADAYGAPSPERVLPAPGTQVLLPQVARLVPPGRAAILRTAYVEHVRAAALAGHDAGMAADLEALKAADLAVVVNPNNPDGRIVPRDTLLRIADDVGRRGGLLVVDESFGDVAPADTTLAGDVRRGNIVVLRSFGKFFGLAGLRLGFAIASPDLIARLDAILGPWAVSGPAVAIGQAAMADSGWRTNTIARLGEDVLRLDRLLEDASLKVTGGTPLYRLASSPRASDVFNRFGRAGIVVRRFDNEPAWLRFGLPGSDDAWQRLAEALATFG